VKQLRNVSLGPNSVQDSSGGKTRTVNISDAVAEALLSGRADAIIAADRDGIIRFWNPGAERLFGYARREALEQSLNLIIPERLRQRHWDGYNRVMSISAPEERFYQRGRTCDAECIGNLRPRRPISGWLGARYSSLSCFKSGS
jgi:PAS domain S-box-containing protein